MRRIAIAFLILIVSPFSALGGPPLLTSDTGTPDVGHWEINVGFIVEKREAETRCQTPDLDMNYGLTDRIQLTLEVPWIQLHENGGDTKNGLGNSIAGAKWRFFDDKDRGLSASIFPQIEFENPESSSADRGLTDKGMQYLLPVQLAKMCGPFGVNLELGYIFKEKLEDEWLYGLAASYALSEKIELVGEVFGTSQKDFKSHDLVFNLGTRYKLSDHYVLLLSAGRSIFNSGVEEAQFLSYLGIQFLF